MQFKGNINDTLKRLLAQEDTDGDKKITIEDQGPKSFEIEVYAFAKAEDKPEDSSTQEKVTIEGTYHLSNLLQELALEKSLGKTEAMIPLWKIRETPTDRINRMIRDYFWDDLTRTIDAEGISKILTDTKASDKVQRMYVSASDKAGIEYYTGLAESFPDLDVQILPEEITPEFVKSINDKPGILALGLNNDKGIPFVVPGGRFNEMYGWDSYFEGVGLLIDNRVDLAKAMIDNFCYQIDHYGKILNANRSYYLTRTQPPFLSSFIRETFEKDPSIGKKWLAKVLKTAIKEYETVWMKKPRLTKSGLNRYYAQGIGVPPETESGHFDEYLGDFARAQGCTINELVNRYQSGEFKSKKLDTYFTHDRSLRESGHDTSWRLDNCCADLNVVDLNSLLFKYESDFAYLITHYFDGNLDGKSATFFLDSAMFRKGKMKTLLWSNKRGQYFDYNYKTKKKTFFESASNFFPLWAGIPGKKKATKMVKALMRDFKELGGISGTSKNMNARIPENAMQRQWDYPNGWAPHQMMIWQGLLQYDFNEEAQELIYRWLWMITKNAVDYNGVIPEKYDVVAATHKVFAEYGNVGTDFDYITSSGFGWMNASYQLGLKLLDPKFRVHLNDLINPNLVFTKAEI